MRIIAGTAKGRILQGPKSDKIRPALDKVKGAIFNILFDVSDLVVLDLFAGTGSIGLEALSRGAKQAVLVDTSPEALKIIFENVRRCHFENQSQVVRLKLPTDLLLLPKKTGIAQFDLIFVDPPYDQGLVNPTLTALAQSDLLAPDAKVIVEHSPREMIGQNTSLKVVDQRKYGQTLISFLTKEPHHQRV